MIFVGFGWWPYGVIFIGFGPGGAVFRVSGLGFGGLDWDAGVWIGILGVWIGILGV